MTFAVVADRSRRTPPSGLRRHHSLSWTGQLISDLLEGIGGDRAAAPSLPPSTATSRWSENSRKTRPSWYPSSKDAQSGMFYGVHQARWAAGDFPAKRLAEPQGRLSALPPPLPARQPSPGGDRRFSAQGASGPSAADAEAGAAKPAGTSQHAVDAAPQPGA